MQSSLEYTLSGHIRETESGLGIAGLLVRAYDKDLLFDDLLGNATTDAEGQFSLQYSEKDFNELFDRQPDIYLVVYGPPQRVLLSTKNAVRWNAGMHETFDLTIPRATLGSLSPVQPTDRVIVDLGLDPAALSIESRDTYDVPKLPHFYAGGVLGAPALLRQTRQLILPRGGDVQQIRITPGEVIRLDGPFNAMPVQQPVPDRGIDPRTGRPLPTSIPFTPPNPRLYESSASDPQAMVQVKRTRPMGPVQIVTLDICPMQYEATTRSYLFYPNLRYEVIFDREAADRTADAFWWSDKSFGEWYAEQLEDLLNNPNILKGPIQWWRKPLQLEPCPHLILTDNFSWPSSVTHPDGSIHPPTVDQHGASLPGDLISEFGRLADWRTQHGMRSRVVSITEILKGIYGDFTQQGFARDLQEVIRNFIKYAHNTWGTLYVVLGGDITIVPMRMVVGALGGGSDAITISLVSADALKQPGNDQPNLIPYPVEQQGYYVPGTSFTKLHANFDPISSQPLCVFSSGRLLTYSQSASADQPGWYFTSEADFTTKNADFERLLGNQPTRYIILEAPVGSLAQESFYWITDVNTIPTDFYYASLDDKAWYGQAGKHDFDQDNSGYYGQYTNNGQAEVSLDGVEFNIDVWVGRIPALSQDGVRVYIDKLITYEELKVPGNPQLAVDPQYTQHVLYAADRWDYHSIDRQTDLTTALAEKHFSHEEGAWATHMHLDFDVQLANGVPNWRLFRNKGATSTEVHYGVSGDLPFWTFLTDDSYADKSDQATRYVLVFGDGTNNDADSFIWYTTAIDRAMDQKEQTRALVAQNYPTFTQASRYYTDSYDLPTPPTLTKLDVTTFRQALNQGPHFVSLTGHGWWGGCCTLDASSEPSFTNARQYFIVFADSCSTARPDDVTSLGESMILNANGGAVAYVGNTRYSWTGLGFGYEQFFWQELASSKRVGIAAGLRLTTAWDAMWTDYAQLLYGDPALNVWTIVPGSKPNYTFKIDREYATISVVHPGDPIMTHVNEQVQPGDPLISARVTLTTEDGLFFASGKTNAYGQIRLSLSGYNERNGPLRLTVLSAGMTLLRDTIANNSKKP